MNYRYGGFYIKISFHLWRRLCVCGREEECIQVRGRQYNHAVCALQDGKWICCKRMHTHLPFSFHCLHGFFSTSIL